MVLRSTRWLALSYFTYFFCYGIFLPFWGRWLQGEGLSDETIGLLLGAGLVARCCGSLAITAGVGHPSRLIGALRGLALVSLIMAFGFWLGNAWLWLLLVMIGFNLFFAPLVPLTDALGGNSSRWTTGGCGCGDLSRLLLVLRSPATWLPSGGIRPF